jgi:bifunctional DNase/RNase
MSEVRLRVWRVEPHSPTQYLLILLDEDQHLLPMTIGLCEAMAIQGMLQSERGIPRPTTTHDLMGELITRLGGRVAKVVIDDLWNKVYFAKLHVTVNGEVVTIDSRPSDAVAIALRAEAPLFATETVIDAANEAEDPPESSELVDESPDVDMDDL